MSIENWKASVSAPVAKGIDENNKQKAASFFMSNRQEEIFWKELIR